MPKLKLENIEKIIEDMDGLFKKFIDEATYNLMNGDPKNNIEPKGILNDKEENND